MNKDHHLHYKSRRWFVSWSEDGGRVWHPTGTGDVREARLVRDRLMEGVSIKIGRPAGIRTRHAARPVEVAVAPQRSLPSEKECEKPLDMTRIRTAKAKPRKEGERPYYVAGCVILLAAVYATREAYDWAMDQLPVARRVDAKRRDAR